MAEAGFRAVRFEFPYMRARRDGEKRDAPDREPVLRQAWTEAIGLAGGPARLAIGGKSLGGRIASMVADEAGVRGLVCLGYPFHPPGQPDRLRTKHLESLATPALIVQGTRDPFGTREDVAGYRLSASISVHWLEDGDHSWKPRASSGRTEAQKEARRSLFGMYRNPLTDDPSVKGLSRGTANTQLFLHHGKLLVLKEDSPPVYMDPLTLETIDD